ncbi:MAG TPA: AsmA family protein [Pseudomonadales bacterium]|nr:AsmA family protein [Pseudomonadales bacterium]
MSRVYTLIAIVILVPVLLLGAAFFLLANPEYYRDQLATTFEEQTGFVLDIKGDIHWRYWPPIALTVSDVNVLPPGAATPLASVGKAAIDLRLLALITGGKTLSVNAIEVNGVKVNALVDKAGHPNWAVQTKTAPTPSTSPSTSQPSSSTPGSSGGGINLEVHRIDVRNTTLNYKDASAGADYTVTIPALTTNALRYDQPMRVTFDLHAVDNKGGLTADLTGDGNVTIGRNFSRIGFSRFDFGEKLQMAGLKDVTSKLRLEGSYDVNASKLQANIDGKLNTSTLKGNVGADLADKTSVNFDLDVDQLSAAEFLPDAPTADSSASARKSSAPPADVDILPLDTLNSIVLHGKLSVGSLAYETYKFSDAKVSIDNQDKNLTADASVKGYDGMANVKFVASTDGVGSGHTNLSVDGIDITKLTGFESITGKVTLSSDTRFTGHMLSSVMNSLDGATTFHVKDGTLDVTPIKRMASVVDGLRGKSSSIASWPDKMPFKFLDGEHHFNNGVKSNQQFNFAVQNINVKGSGGLDYFKNHLSYDLGVSLKQAEGSPIKVSDWLVGVDWPVHCEGAMDASPADMCKPDKNGIQKAIGQTLKNKAQDTIKDKIKDKVGNALKGLFGG